MLLSAIVILLCACLLVWAITTYLPGPEGLKKAACFLVVLLAILWILDVMHLARVWRW